MMSGSFSFAIWKKGDPVERAFWRLSLPLIISSICLGCHRPHPSAVYEGMVKIPSGIDKNGARIKSFYLDKTPVTVAQFSAFVQGTGYRTEAERFGNAGVFLFDTGKWAMVAGANYKFPFGPSKSASSLTHPVTQISWNDARAYCVWRHRRLPTRVEWNWAACNAQHNYSAAYPWGNALVMNGHYQANVWEGSFPYVNTCKDLYLATSPVGVFGFTKLGLSDMGGNVWQWCQDWKTPTERVQMGGSFLCDYSVCHGYHRETTSSSTPETSLCHVGFRTAAD